MNGQGQTPSACDEADGLLLLNMLLTEWQLNRWLVWDLVVRSAVISSLGTSNYTVGAGV